MGLQTGVVAGDGMCAVLLESNVPDLTGDACGLCAEAEALPATVAPPTAGDKAPALA